MGLTRFQFIRFRVRDRLGLGGLAKFSWSIIYWIRKAWKMDLANMSANYWFQYWAKVVNIVLTHCGRVTHICLSKLTIIGSDNGLSPVRRQAIIWTYAGILLIGPLGPIFSEILIEILTFSFTKMRLKVSSAKWRPFCLGLNVLMPVWCKSSNWLIYISAPHSHGMIYFVKYYTHSLRYVVICTQKYIHVEAV